MYQAFKTKPILLLLLVSTLTLVAQKKNPAAPAPPISAGADQGIVATTSGKLRGYTHNGIFTFKF